MALRLDPSIKRHHSDLKSAFHRKHEIPRSTKRLKKQSFCISFVRMDSYSITLGASTKKLGIALVFPFLFLHLQIHKTIKTGKREACLTSTLNHTLEFNPEDSIFETHSFVADLHNWLIHQRTHTAFPAPFLYSPFSTSQSKGCQGILDYPNSPLQYLSGNKCSLVVD